MHYQIKTVSDNRAIDRLLSNVSDTCAVSSVTFKPVINNDCIEDYVNQTFPTYW
jgi:hypothetical protein